MAKPLWLTCQQCIWPFLWPWPWVKVIFTCMFLEVLSHSTFGSSFTTLLLIVSEISAKFNFSTFQGHPVTLTLGRGPHLLHHFKGLVTKYLWVKFHNSTVNSVRDISQSSIFQYFKVTLWPWPWVKVITNSMVWKVLPQSTLGPSFITLLLVVSEILSMFEFVTSRRSDAGGSLHRLTLLTHVSQKLAAMVIK